MSESRRSLRVGGAPAFVRVFLPALMLVLLLAACSGDTPRALHIGAGPGLPKLFADALARQWGDEARVNNTELITRQTGDCCAAVSQWGLSSRELDLAVMCPDAARMLLEKNSDYLSLGPLVLDGDVLVRRLGTAGDGPVRTVGVAHQRSAQKALAQDAYPDAKIVEMLPAALPYALERTVVDAVVLDALTARQLPVRLAYLPEKTAERPTQVLVMHRRLTNLHELAAALKRAAEYCNGELAAVLNTNKENTGWIKPLTKFVSPPASALPSGEAALKPLSGD